MAEHYRKGGAVISGRGATYTKNMTNSSSLFTICCGNLQRNMISTNIVHDDFWIFNRFWRVNLTSNDTLHGEESTI